MGVEERKFKIHIITSLDLAGLADNLLQDISTAIVDVSRKNKWWTATDGLRYSLIKCFTQPNHMVCGWITQEHILEQHLYDDEKRESMQNVQSYEDRFFVICLRDNSAVFEWRQFRGKQPLTLPSMVDRMALILSEIVTDAGVGKIVQLEQIEKETTRDEFIKLFYEKDFRMIEVAVEQFGRYSIPVDAILVNPNQHLEGAAREIVQHDVIHPSISKLTAEAKEGTGADLKKSVFTRAALHSGQPTQIRYSDNTGQIKVRRKTEKGELEVYVPTSDNDTHEERIAIATAVINAVNKIDIGRTIETQEKTAKQLDIFRQDN